MQQLPSQRKMAATALNVVPFICIFIVVIFPFIQRLPDSVVKAASCSLGSAPSLAFWSYALESLEQWQT
jgi:hypothetical protein